MNVFYREAADPTALATGVDQFLFGGQAYRLPVTSGNKLAFIPETGTTGSVYITPDSI